MALAYNLGEDVKNLWLSREDYCGIAQGEVINWNDPLITANIPTSI